MNIRLAGLSHKTASVEERERALEEFRRLPGTLLATCNRVELYQNQKSKIKNQNEGIYYYENEEAVRHLFRVASGLDSQILGESEILGQIKDVYLKFKGRDRVLDEIFQQAIEAGRRVRIETGVAQGNVSIASVAVAKARNLTKKKILLIGTGKVNESIIKTLLKLNFNFICIANRTFNKALEVASRLGGKAVRFDRLPVELEDSDLVISGTSAPHFILRSEQVRRRVKPLIIIDLAVPRDVDPEVSKIPGVELLNVDDIREEISFNLARRKLEAVLAERIIQEEVRDFCEKFALERAPAA